MIIRAEPEGGLTLILQTEHSQFVGRLAAHWGSAAFAALQPYRICRPGGNVSRLRVSELGAGPAFRC